MISNRNKQILKYHFERNKGFIIKCIGKRIVYEFIPLTYKTLPFQLIYFII